MGQLASKGQLRMSLLRWALVTVPAILFLGLLSGRLSGSGEDNVWFRLLSKPDWFPPGWVFGAVWSSLYVLLGLSLAMILNARGARGRTLPIAAFALQLVMNLAWSPLFFAAHQVTLAFWLSIAIRLAAVITAWAFSRIRAAAALLLLPYLAWLSFAAVLAWEIDTRNPGAESLTPKAAETQILL